MKPTKSARSAAARALLPACLVLTAASALAQQAPANVTTAELQRYDTNRNGVLDPDEQARMRDDQAKANSAGATAVSTGAPGSVGTAPTDAEKPLQLSPFTVTSEKDSGYFAENTLAGSRLNTNLADLAASITVVTKQQMEDTASVDINDVFKYEANTEGASTYSPSVVDRGTVKDTIAGYTFGNNGDTTTAAQSNRIRGLSAPDAGLNNFSVNNRIPFDSYNTQSIEISRGPNSLLFGLGSPAGIVNQNASQAVLNREANSVNVRFDQNGSYRGSLTFNRPLIKDKLAMFGAILYDNRQFERKPSRDLYRRQYGALTFKPFSKTVIRGFAENYRNDANRPNFFTPRDYVTPWLDSGRPIYDPLTRMVTIQSTGRTVGPYLNSTLSPGFVSTAVTPTGFGQLTTTTSPLYVPGIVFDDTGRPIRLIDNGRVVATIQRNPTVTYRQGDANPAVNNSTATFNFVPQDPRYAILDRGWTASGSAGIPAGPVINGTQYSYQSWQDKGVTDQGVYDWTKYNTLQTNFGQVKAANYNVELEQQLFDATTSYFKHSAFFNAGWLRQDIEEWDNYTINQLQGATISVDTNKNLPDGTPNAYLGIPFISEGVGGGLDTYHTPETDDNYRAMLAYEIDFREKSNKWLGLLGKQRILGLWSEQDVYRQTERWRMNFTGGDALTNSLYVSNLAVPGTRQALSTATMRKFYLGSPGAAQATTTHSIGFYGNQGWDGPFSSQIRVYNPATNRFEDHPIEEEILFSSAGNNNASQREVKTKQLALQSYLWGERLVTTFGWRVDDYRARVTTDGQITNEQGQVVAPPITDAERYTNGINGREDLGRILKRWNHWDRLSGGTRTLGGAFRPLHNLNFVRRIGGGEGTFVTQLLDGLTLYYNESANFNPPASFQTDMFGNVLPKPTGKGRDGGFGLNLFNNKLVARVNWYETENINERTSAASTLLTRSAYPDTTLGLPWAQAVLRIRRAAQQGIPLQQLITMNNGNWNTNTVIDISSEADQRLLYDMIKLPYQYYSGISPGATQQSKAKGVEVQLTYNPLRNWTIKLTGAKNQSIYNKVAPEFDAWVGVRMPVWTTLAATDIPDFTDANGVDWSLKNFWQGYGYSSNTRRSSTNPTNSTQQYWQNTVESIVGTTKALEGAVAPSQRIYQGSVLTNYSFTSEQFGGKLKGWALGGSARWQSKAAIGYYGKPGDPTRPTVINLSDITRPIYDQGIFNSDVWISYSRKIYNDRIGMKLQLNVNNWNESGRLMPTQVNYDGSPWAFRIIDPRQFILQATFTF